MNTGAIDDVLNHRRRFGVSRPDLIQTLLEANKTDEGKISIEDVKAQALIYFLGGFETVSTALSFTVYELAVNQEVQEKPREEVQQIWKDQNGRLSFGQLSRMKYMDMVISGGPVLYVI